VRKFLYWGQVHQRLIDHAAETGKCFSFYDAVRQLWEEGAASEAEELPAVSFENWNVDDLDELERLLDQTPVKLETFFRDFRAELPAHTAVRQTQKLESAPIRIATYQKMGFHTISSMELLYVARGGVQLALESASCTLQEKSFVILRPELSRDIVAEPGSLLISVALTEQMIEETLYRLLQKEDVLSDFFRSGLGGTSGYLVFQVEHPQQILTVLRGILHECYTKGEYSRQICFSYFEILFAMLLRQSANYEFRRVARQQGTFPVLAALKYIQDNFRTASLQEAAKQFHYEPSYFGKQIKAATGKNYTEIIRSLRIEEAKRLLSETELSMSEVAAKAGFDSRVNFFRSFREALGKTPGEYREENAPII